MYTVKVFEIHVTQEGHYRFEHSIPLPTQTLSNFVKVNMKYVSNSNTDYTNFKLNFDMCMM